MQRTPQGALKYLMLELIQDWLWSHIWSVCKCLLCFDVCPLLHFSDSFWVTFYLVQHVELTSNLSVWEIALISCSVQKMNGSEAPFTRPCWTPSGEPLIPILLVGCKIPIGEHFVHLLRHSQELATVLSNFLNCIN